MDIGAHISKKLTQEEFYNLNMPTFKKETRPGMGQKLITKGYTILYGFTDASTKHR